MSTLNSPPKHMGMTSKIVCADALSPREISAWDQLSQDMPYLRSPFLSSAFARAVAGVRRRVYIGILERAGLPIGFLPFQYRTALHEAARIAEPVGEYMSDYAGLIADPTLRITGPELLGMLGLTYIRLPYIDGSQASYGLELARGSTGHLVQLEQGPQAYWEELKARDKKLVAELGRRERNIVREFGPLKFRFSESDWEGPLMHLMERKSEQYQRTGREDLFADGWRRRLLFALAARPHPTCTAVLSTLYAGNTWLASHFGLRNGSVLNYYFPVYNADLHRYGPGLLLLKGIIDACADERIERIDRGAGDSPAKRDFSNATHQIFRTAWFRPGLRSFVYRAGCSVMWRLSAMQRRLSESARA